jgi:conjugative transposon TraM protein
MVHCAGNKTSINHSDLDRLEQMMDLTKNEQSDDDPEMKQLSSMMEKIIDIQHPDRVKENIRQTSQTNKGQVFAVTANSNDEPISLLTNEKSRTFVQDSSGQGQIKYNQFYELSSPQDNQYSTAGLQNTIAAVIHQTQTLMDGAIAKLRLTSEVYINGMLIPRGSFVFGIASLNGERLNIKISSIRYKNALFHVDLTVVDLDGIDGIYIPGAITRDAAKGIADRSIEGVGLSSLDPSIIQQAAGAGIEAAKTLLSKKVKLIKITVKAGYQILLRDEKQKISP